MLQRLHLGQAMFYEDDTKDYEFNKRLALARALDDAGLVLSDDMSRITMRLQGYGIQHFPSNRFYAAYVPHKNAPGTIKAFFHYGSGMKFHDWEEAYAAAIAWAKANR